MPDPRRDPHTDCLLDALPRPWTPPANDWSSAPLAPARGILVGCGTSLAFLGMALVLAWVWR